METFFKKLSDWTEHEKESPLPLEVIPNKMGINVSCVEALSWQKQDDGQLTSLTIYFIPGKNDEQ